MNKQFLEEVLPHYRWLLANAPRLNKKEAFEIMEKSHESGFTTLMLWKIPNESYEKWYKTAKQNNMKDLQSIEDETTYIVSSNNKAFGCYCGYSIFATSIGAEIRNLPYGELDRIEHMGFEYAIVIYIAGANYNE